MKGWGERFSPFTLDPSPFLHRRTFIGLAGQSRHRPPLGWGLEAQLSNLALAPDGLTFDFGEKRFRYDRLGLRSDD